MAFSGKIWVLGGGGWNGGGVGYTLNDVWSSPDAINWTKVCDAPWSPRGGHSTVVLDGRMWLIGGTVASDVWCSQDGANWVQQTANGPFPPRCFHASFAYKDRLWILGGETCLNDVWYSEFGADDVTFSIVSNHGPWYQAGEPMDLVMTPSTPTGALTYQWYQNGQPIPDATEATYHVSQLEDADAGSYTCQVADPFQGANAAGPLLMSVAAKVPAGSFPSATAAAVLILFWTAAYLRRTFYTRSQS